MRAPPGRSGGYRGDAGEVGCPATSLAGEQESSPAASASIRRPFAELLGALPGAVRSAIVAEIDAAYQLGRAAALAIEPRSAKNAHRLRARNAAIRGALAFYSNMPRTASCKALARDLEHYLTAPSWRRDREFVELPDAEPLRQMLHSIARLNHGETLGWRQIINVTD